MKVKNKMTEESIKARALVLSFQMVEDIGLVQAQKCALIAVEELMNNTHGVTYWKNVIIEIKNI